MCPSGAGQHAPGHDIRGQHGRLAWSCCDFNMFGFTWASDRSCLSTAASSCSRLGVCRQVTYDQTAPGCCCLPMSYGRSRARTFHVMNEQPWKLPLPLSAQILQPIALAQFKPGRAYP